MARGKSRSNSIENVLVEIKKIAGAGVKEIVLTGINLGDFGRDDHGKKTSDNFYGLLQAIEKNEGAETDTAFHLLNPISFEGSYY